MPATTRLRDLGGDPPAISIRRCSIDASLDHRGQESDPLQKKPKKPAQGEEQGSHDSTLFLLPEKERQRVWSFVSNDFSRISGSMSTSAASLSGQGPEQGCLRAAPGAWVLDSDETIACRFSRYEGFNTDRVDQLDSSEQKERSGRMLHERTLRRLPAGYSRRVKTPTGRPGVGLPLVTDGWDLFLRRMTWRLSRG